MGLGLCCVTQASLVPGQDSPSLTNSWNLLGDNSLGFLVNGIWLEQAVPAPCLPTELDGIAPPLSRRTRFLGQDGGSVTLLSPPSTDTEAEGRGP